MNCVLSKAGKFPQLILAIGGISLLLASCANTNEKTANVNSAFPISYNTGARGFEARWPYGPAGYH
jgi:hypothetical protein